MTLYISEKTAQYVAATLRKQGQRVAVFRKTVRETDGSLSRGFVVQSL